MPGRRITRREFLGVASAAAAGPGLFRIVPPHVLGRGRHTAPSDTVTAALIGCGQRGAGGLGCVGPHKLIARCDVDLHHLGREPNRRTQYTDFRRLLERRDLDAVCIATPPHWHALIALAAARAGKDIFCEPPMTRFLAEGRAVVEACRRHGRVFQIGTFGRFGASRVRANVNARRILSRGLLPRDEAPRILVNRNWRVRQWSGRRRLAPQPVPAGLRYDFWLGPAPYKPYHPHRVHRSFRGYWDYGGGGLADMGQHYLDALQWTLGKDHTSPVEVRARAPRPAHPDACGPWGWVEMTYADGTAIVLETDEWGEPYPHASRRLPEPSDLTEAQRRSLRALPDLKPMASFAEAVRTRRPAGGHAEAAHRCATLLHLANLAIRLGRTLHYDPDAERLVGDDEANRLANPPMRPPWHL